MGGELDIRKSIRLLSIGISLSFDCYKQALDEVYCYSLCNMLRGYEYSTENMNSNAQLKCVFGYLLHTHYTHFRFFSKIYCEVNSKYSTLASKRKLDALSRR